MHPNRARPERPAVASSRPAGRAPCAGTRRALGGWSRQGLDARGSMDIQNHFYGHSAALALAAGLPRPRHIPGVLQQQTRT